MREPKVAKIRVVPLLMILAVVFGFLYGIEEQSYVFRLKHIEVVPRSSLLENEASKLAGGSASRFWPLVFFEYKHLKNEVEKKYPIQISMKAEGWGRVVLQWTQLQPYFSVRWRDRKWFITTAGLCWPESNPLWKDGGIDNTSYNELNIVWDNTMPPLVPDIDSTDLIEVRQSIFPVRTMVKFIEEMHQTPWVEKIRGIALSKLAGDIVAEVSFASMGRDVNILLEFSESIWKSLSPAIETIVKSSDANVLYLDATYKDKIVIKTR